jgi:hypothetical protein
VDLEATKKGYPLVVKRGNGKSLFHGGFNGKIIHSGIFHCHDYRKVGGKMWTFDCWTSVLSYPGEGKHMNIQGCTQIMEFSQAQPQRTTTTHRFAFLKIFPTSMFNISILSSIILPTKAQCRDVSWRTTNAPL